MDLLNQTPKRVYYRKQIPLYRLIEKMKLWPSRTGILHGIESFEEKGPYVRLKTYCHQEFIIRDSKNGRASRWLRNQWFLRVCKECLIPGWKLEKYSATHFKRRWGSFLTNQKESTKS